MLVGLDLPSAGGGTEAGVRAPHWGNCLNQRKHLRLRLKQLIYGSLNGMRIRQPLQQPYIPQMVQCLGAGLGVVEPSLGDGCC